jgi:predicted metal-dependent hydrolase
METNQFQQGIDAFNQGDYYACHDLLEEIWLESEPSDRNFYQGIIQIAVALYHLRNHNLQGAMILLGEGSNRLKTYEQDYYGVETQRLRKDARVLLAQLQQMTVEEIPQFLATTPELPRVYQVLN